MGNDWKDALSALRGSLDEPSDMGNEEVSEDKEVNKIQKEPLKVVRDKKGRNGKTATIIEGFEGSRDSLEELARNLKQKLATGGSIREGEILIQGDRVNDVCAYLKKLGYKVKIIG